MKLRGTRARRAEKSASPLWLWPAAAGFGAFLGATFAVDVPLSASLHRLAWPGDADSARAMLQTVAGSVITVTALAFTLLVVALQLASQQFSPRLLRDFARDRVAKATLAALLAALVYTTAILRSIDAEVPLPDVALLIGAGLGLIAVAAILGFINHMTRVLRVDTMMRRVHDETDTVIAAFYPAYDDPRPRSPDELKLDPRDAIAVDADRSGFVQVVDVESLVRAARRHDARVWIEARPGDHVVRGTPLAQVWVPGHVGDRSEFHRAVRRGVRIGYERTIEQDAAFGFRQLTDIAVRALSPAINDPVTAAHAVGHMADLLVQLSGRRLGPTLHQDTDGVDRLVVPDRDLPYYLDLVCGPIRRYGRAEPTVLVALLRMLRDIATATRDDCQRTHLAWHADLILGEMPDGSAAHDAEQVHTMARRVTQALQGDVRAAYEDSNGSTRSI